MGAGSLGWVFFDGIITLLLGFLLFLLLMLSRQRQAVPLESDIEGLRLDTRV